MPYQTVAQHLQVVLIAVVDELVGATEVNDDLSGSQRLWLHTVLSDSTVKVLVDDGISLRNLSVALPLVNGCTNQTVFANSIFQPLGLYKGHIA